MVGRAVAPPPRGSSVAAPEGHARAMPGHLSALPNGSTPYSGCLPTFTCLQDAFALDRNDLESLTFVWDGEANDQPLKAELPAAQQTGMLACSGGHGGWLRTRLQLSACCALPADGAAGRREGPGAAEARKLAGAAEEARHRHPKGVS